MTNGLALCEGCWIEFAACERKKINCDVDFQASSVPSTHAAQYEGYTLVKKSGEWSGEWEKGFSRWF